MDLFLSSPFGGHESPYLRPFMDAYAAMAEGLEAESLWYFNGREREFYSNLLIFAKQMPIPVEVMWEPLPVLGNTDAIRKNNAVALAHSRAFHELRKRNEEAYVFVHESDVLVPVGGIQRLKEDLDAHPGLGAISAAVPDPRGGDPPQVGTMAWRIRPKHDGAYTVPGDGPVVSYYLPELGEGVEIVDAVPFGALMTRLSAFQEVPLATTMFPGMGVDQEWSVNSLYQNHMPVAIDWSVRCGHIRDWYGKYDDLRLHTTTAAPREVGIA